MAAKNWKIFLWERLQTNIQKQGLSSCYMALALPTPSVRTVVFRSFAGEHYHDQLGWNSECLVVTSDKRSHKFKEIRNDRRYEVCWYMDGTGEQFRLAGNLFAYPQDEASVLPPVWPCPARAEAQHIVKLGNKAFVRRQEGKSQFDWEAERRRHFGLLDDGLRATFSPKKPPPPALSITGLDAEGWYISPNQQELNEAYENFCLIILTVKKVDYVSLAGAHEIYKL